MCSMPSCANWLSSDASHRPSTSLSFNILSPCSCSVRLIPTPNGSNAPDRPPATRTGQIVCSLHVGGAWMGWIGLRTRVDSREPHSASLREPPPDRELGSARMMVFPDLTKRTAHCSFRCGRAIWEGRCGRRPSGKGPSWRSIGAAPAWVPEPAIQRPAVYDLSFAKEVARIGPCLVPTTGDELGLRRQTVTVTKLLGTLRTILANAVIATALLDAVSFALLPSRVASSFWPYRCTDCEPPAYMGSRTFPQGYFTTDSATGFDISPEFAKTLHWVDGRYYHVWSNKLGCFNSDALPATDYLYLAGDSFSWGFAPFKSTFGTLIERELNISVVKCGIPHSGQAHQLKKARKVIEQIGKTPKVIVLQYYTNDVCNDLAFPHSVVVDGWLVDNKKILNHSGIWTIQTRQVEQLAELLKSKRAEMRPATDFDDALFRLKRYSISVNLLERIFYRVRSALVGSHAIAATSVYGVYAKGLCDLSTPPSYYGSPYVNSRDSLRAFKTYASNIGSRLLVVLIPPRNAVADYLNKLKGVLTTEEIDFIDMSPSFAVAQAKGIQLYWTLDIHLNVTGNALVADEIVAYLRPRLLNDGPTSY